MHMQWRLGACAHGSVLAPRKVLLLRKAGGGAGSPMTSRDFRQRAPSMYGGTASK